ncbi:MAG: SRPBCC family protein [Acidimicrobiia bacterium]
MPVTSVTKDPEALTMTVVCDFPVPVERLWTAYADPRQLERFWGPPGWPATFTHHEMSPGGRADYHLTGPDGERFHGYWEFVSVEAPHSFEVHDGFAHPDGSPNTDMPAMRLVMQFDATAGGSRSTSVTHFASAEQLEEVLAMGAEEGAVLSMGQLDQLLADLRDHARTTEAEILSDTLVRITRFFDHPRDEVWRAHTEPDLIRRWLLGPDGWTMPTCEVDLAVGGAVRYGWAPAEGTEGTPFVIEGETQWVEAPFRWVTTESMEGIDGPPTTNDLTLTEVDGGTLLTILMTYPSAEARDVMLGTGMTDGMEASYGRLATAVLAHGV